MSFASIVQTFHGCQSPAPRQSRFVLFWQTHHPQHLLPCSSHGSALHMHPRTSALGLLLWMLLPHRWVRRKGVWKQQERSQSRHRLGTLQQTQLQQLPAAAIPPCSADPSFPGSCGMRVRPRCVPTWHQAIKIQELKCQYRKSLETIMVSYSFSTKL